MGANGKLQPFLRDKLFLSLHKSCQHRPTALTDATALTATIIAQLRGSVHAGILDHRDIIAAALGTLSNFDKAAAVYYEAYHPLSGASTSKKVSG